MDRVVGDMVVDNTRLAVDRVLEVACTPVGLVCRVEVASGVVAWGDPPRVVAWGDPSQAVGAAALQWVHYMCQLGMGKVGVAL